MSDTESDGDLFRVEAVVGHRASADPYHWQFELKWKYYSDDQGTFEFLNDFMVEGSWMVEEKVAAYLAKEFKGSKNLLKEIHGGHTRYSVWDIKQMRRSVLEGKLKVFKNLSTEGAQPQNSGNVQSKAEVYQDPMPNDEELPVLPILFSEEESDGDDESGGCDKTDGDDKSDVTKVVRFKEETDGTQFFNAGDGWKALDDVCDTSSGRAIIQEFLKKQFEGGMKLCTRYDRKGNFKGYVILDKS